MKETLKHPWEMGVSSVKANGLMLMPRKVASEASLWMSPRPHIRPLAAPCPAGQGSISCSAHEADAPGAALATHISSGLISG